MGAKEGCRILVAGATGYIGQYVTRALIGRGHKVIALARPKAGVDAVMDETAIRQALAGAEVRFGQITNPASIARDGFRGEDFDIVVSCLATRTGEPRDAWRIEHRANLDLLAAGRAVGMRHFVLLSAICVQKPQLEFQRAKLAFEEVLRKAGITWSIVRPTAFFKSLAGQVEKVKAGQPFTVFGNGEITACKPISETDLASFIADCVDDPTKHNAILPVGGPGLAITPRMQGEMLFELTGQVPRFRHVPLALFDAIIGGLSISGRVFPGLRAKASLARIGRYYATESMLLWDEKAGRYDAEATPAHGRDTLRDFYVRVLDEGLSGQELGRHALF